jgi:hypothetical protein
MYNPSLRQYPRYQKAPIIPLKQDVSILDWLERTGRLIAREEIPASFVDEEAELVELMGNEDDPDFDLDSDDDLEELE